MNLAAIHHAAQVIRAGGVVAYPTEWCFGLGCDPRNPHALRRILRIKRRARQKGMIVIAARPTQLLAWVKLRGVARYAEIAASWPGPNTWLLPATARASCDLRGNHSTLAVRVIAHPIAARLCQFAATAIVSTSANRAAHPPLRSAAAVRREFAGEVDFVLDGRVGNARAPSTIRHFQSGAVLRGA